MSRFLDGSVHGNDCHTTASGAHLFADGRTLAAGATVEGPDKGTLPMEPAGVDRPAPAVYGGRYAVERELGRGGMGRVLLARDVKLRRRVALKVLPPGSHDERQRLRFEQEARAAGALNHPNIVAVHDVGEHEGEPYIVTELLEGRTLRALLREDQIASQQALDLCLQLAQGLAAAHGKGIVHRDLKPENLFVTGEGRLKILDFGIAKLLPETKATDDPTLRTDTGGIVGTPAYMSPEQIRGDAADARSDVFACGAVIQEIVSGRPPFSGATSVETAYAILHDPPAALPGSPLTPIVGRCLEKEPAARYANAGELLQDLEALSRGVRIQVRGALRRRVPAIAIAGAVALVIAAIAWQIGRKPSGGGKIRMAVADVVNQTDDKDLGSLSGMLITSLEQSRRLSVLPRSRMFDLLREMGKRDAGRIDEALGREVALRAQARALLLADVRRFGEVYSIDLKVLDPVRNEYVLAFKDQGQGKESIPSIIDRLTERVRTGFDETPDEIRAASSPIARRTTSSLEAYRHLFEGEQIVLTRGLYDEGMKAFRKAIALDPDFALAQLRLLQAGGFDADLGRLRTLVDRLSERDRCSADATLEGIGAARFDASLASLQRCADHFPEDRWTVRLAADVSFHAGDLDAAVRYFERARVTGTIDAEADNHLMWIWQIRGRFDRMVAEATERVRQHHDANEYRNLIWAHGAAGNDRAVEETLREMERLFPGRFMPFSIRQAMFLYAGDPERAETLLARPEFDSGDSRRIFQVLVHVHRGRFSKALTLIDQRAAQPVPPGWLKEKKARILLDRGDVAGAWNAAAESVAAGLGGLERFELHCDLGDPDGASAVLDSALRQRGAPFVHLKFAAAKARRERRPRDEIAIVEKLAADPTIRQDSLLRLGSLHLGEGQPRKAIDALHTALIGFHWRRYGTPFMPMNLVSGWYQLAQAYDAAGEEAKALDAYRRVLRMWNDADPGLPEVLDAQARVAALAAR